MVEHSQTGRTPGWLRSTGQIHEEVLQPGAVDTIIAHPFEMAEHGWGTIGAEQLGLAAAGIGEARRWITLRRGIVGHVRPHLERQEAGRDPPRIATPMNPAHLGSIIRAAEPALVTAHYLAPQGRCVHGAGAAHWLRRSRRLSMSRQASG